MTARPPRTRAWRRWSVASRRSSPWSARPGRLHLEVVTKVSRDENLAMIADSVALLRRRRQARRSTTPSTSSTAGATIPATRWPASRPRSTPGPRTSRSATRTARACRTRSRRRRPPSSPRSTADRVSVGIHTHNDAECGVANSIAAVRAGATLVQGTINGYGERTGNANLVSILPALQLKLGYDCVAARPAAAADRDRAPRRRDLQPRAGPLAALRRPQRLRPQGRHARGRRRGRRADLRAHGPARRRQRRARS